jgi:uncharacterized protein DUF3592
LRSSIYSLIRPALIWLALFSGITTFLFWNNIFGALKVMRNHEIADGTITQLLPKEHRTVVASYEVHGHQYTTATSLPDQLGLPQFERLRVGDKVKVEYNPALPAHGILGSAEKLLAADIKDITALGIFLVFAAGYFEFNIRRYVRKARSRVGATDHANS